MTPISPMVEGSTANVSDDPFFYGWRYVERKRDDGTIFSEQVPLTEWDVLHPQEGDFIMTNDAHSEICRYLKGAFRYHLTNHPGALVLGDHRVDWQVEGIEPHGPDLSVFFDSAPWDPRRGTYPMHDMGARPICAIEVTLPSTRSGDFGAKITEYCAVGIPLYVIIDLPEENEPLDIRFLAFHPTPNGPEQILLPDESRIWIPEVNLWIAIGGEYVICLDSEGNPIRDLAGQAQLAQEEKQRADRAEKLALDEKRKKEAALKRAEDEKREKETALKEKEATFKRAEDEKREKEIALKKAQDEKQRADDEKQRADESLRRVQELEAELKRMRGETT